MLEKTLPLIFLFLLGYFLKYRKILNKEDSTTISKLLSNLVIPAIVVNVFSTATIDKRSLLFPIAGLILVCSLFVIGWLLALLLRLRGKTKSAFLIAFPTLEGGGIGYPFMLAAFGTIGLSKIVLFDLGSGIFLFLVVYTLASFFGKGKEHFKIRDGLLLMIKTPVLWAIVIGILFNFSHIHFPLLTNLLTTIGSSVFFLVMLLLGIEFTPSFSSLKLPLVTIFLKTSIALCIGFLLIILFHFTGLEKKALLVESLLPASTLTVILAKENNLDTHYIANMISLALVCGILFETILIFALH